MIKKEILTKFIEKYSLGGNIETVNWKYDFINKTLQTRGELDTKSLTMDVIMHGFSEFSENLRIPIATTLKFKEMLSPYDGDISLRMNKSGDRILGFYFGNVDCESYCPAANPTAIPPVTADLSENITYDADILLSDEFVSQFLKIKASLKESEDFIVKPNVTGNIEFGFGLPSGNGHRTLLKVTPLNGIQDFSGNPPRFPLKYISEILKSNKECSDGILKICFRGILKFQYKTSEFTSTYWQLAFVK